MIKIFEIDKAIWLRLEPLRDAIAVSGQSIAMLPRQAKEWEEHNDLAIEVLIAKARGTKGNAIGVNDCEYWIEFKVRLPARYSELEATNPALPDPDGAIAIQYVCDWLILLFQGFDPLGDATSPMAFAEYELFAPSDEGNWRAMLTFRLTRALIRDTIEYGDRISVVELYNARLPVPPDPTLDSTIEPV